MKDGRLIHRLLRADPDALRQIYHRHKDDLFTAAMVLLADPESFAKVGRAMVVTTLLLAFSFGGLLCSQLARYGVFAALAVAGFVAALVGHLLILPALFLCLRPKGLLSVGAKRT